MRHPRNTLLARIFNGWEDEQRAFPGCQFLVAVRQSRCGCREKNNPPGNLVGAIRRTLAKLSASHREIVRRLCGRQTFLSKAYDGKQADLAGEDQDE